MGNLRGLLDDLLDVILTEAAVADVVDLADEGYGLRLADRHHSNLLRRPTASLRRLLGPGEHRAEGRRGGAFRGWRRHDGAGPVRTRGLARLRRGDAPRWW